MNKTHKHPSFEDDEFGPEKQMPYTCLDCGRMDFYALHTKAPEKCIYCTGCLLPMRRLSSRRRMEQEEEGAETVTRYCVFCKAKLRSQNAFPVCTSLRCWKQYSVLSLAVSAPLEIERIIIREYRKLGGASYLRASLITIGKRRWVVDGYFRVCLPPPGLLFDGRVTMCKRKSK
jgi:hypothetical protein